MKIRPLHDRILCTRAKAQDKIGSLHIPEMAKEQPAEFHVEAVGPGKRLPDGTYEKLAVTVGDHILAGKFAGVDIEVGGTAYVILSEPDVLGILDKPAEETPELHKDRAGSLRGISVES